MAKIVEKDVEINGTIYKVKVTEFNDYCAFNGIKGKIEGHFDIPSMIDFGKNGKKKVTHIEPGAFENQPELTFVSIPNSVTIIEKGAFVNCGFSDVTIPRSAMMVRPGAFSDCPNLKTVYAYAPLSRDTVIGNDEVQFVNISDEQDRKEDVGMQTLNRKFDLLEESLKNQIKELNDDIEELEEKLKKKTIILGAIVGVALIVAAVAVVLKFF